VKSSRPGEGAGRRRRTQLWGAIAIACLLTATACSGGSRDDAEDDAGSNGGDSAVVTDAMTEVTEVDLPTEPFTQPTGKHILIMPCGSAGQGCVNEANEATRVAESLGWTVDNIDGKLDPTVWNQTVKQAADAGVDGIISVSADPNLMAEAMAVVATKDIPFVLTEQTPGDDDVEGIDVYIAPDPKVGGADVAEWMIADSDGKANVLVLDFPGYTNVQQRATAIVETLESDCEGCTVEKVDVAVQTMGTTLTPQVTSLLQSNPEQMAQLKTGEMAADLATPTWLAAWLAIDQLGRLMASEETQKFWPLPQRIFSEGNIDDAPTEASDKGWNTGVDYESLFNDLWGTSE
jgi:ribose transport system substrate-binding protein